MNEHEEIDPREHLRRLASALDEERPSDEEAREVVAALGIDIPGLAARIRARIAAAPVDAAAGQRDRLRLAYEAHQARGQGRVPEPIRPRAEQIMRMRALMDRAQGRTIAAHFRKFEEAGDEELAALVTSLRDLLDDEDGGGELK